MSRNSRSQRKSKERIVAVRIEDQRLSKWKQFAESHGFRSLSSFVIFCVENTITPLTNTGDNELTDYIEKLKNDQTNLISLLQEKIATLNNLTEQHAKFANNEELREKIVKYLKKMGPTNEYVISSDIDCDPVDVYHELCRLSTENKVDQLTEDGGVKWKAK